MDMRFTNIVSKDKLREVQLDTLQVLADTVAQTAGPYGSNTQIIKQQAVNEYTKDGHNVLSAVQFYKPIEIGIQQEMKEVTRYIVKTVGDGTTSAVLLSYNIFKSLYEMELSHPDIRPYQLINTFKLIVDKLIEYIKENTRECKIEDIYDICMISTNGNKEISESISQIYKKYGRNVFIDVAVSPDEHHRTKEYNGLTLGRGFASPSFINTSDGKCIIQNPRIYSFADPIDDPIMVNLFKSIIYNNIQLPASSGGECIPTVIMVPSVTRDITQWIKDIEIMMYSFDEHGGAKPPLCIITQSNVVQDQLDDIVTLCGIKEIKKYIDPEVYKQDIEKGEAPTNETVVDFYGTTEEFVSDMSNTSFKRPGKMFDVDENGNEVYSAIYNGLINFYKKELKNAQDNMEDANVTGNLKRRLNSLEVNFVEYFIGGVTVTDRDSLRASVEDAVLNCRSAMKDGVGYGANFEGFRAIDEYRNSGDDTEIGFAISTAIYDAYYETIKNLYKTCMPEHTAVSTLSETIDRGMPINITTMEYDGKVLTSAKTDIAILEAIAKVITIMFTANQCLIPSPTNNTYREDDGQ